MKKIYHVSNIKGLKVLEPRLSSHGKAYVYGIEYLPLGLLFGAQGMRDFDSSVIGRDINNPNTPAHFVECIKGAIDRYKGASCYVYELEPTDFQTGKTSWNEELVSEKPVKVLKCTKVNDIYAELLKYEKTGKLQLHRYEDNLKSEYWRNFMHDHIKQTITSTHILEYPDHPAYKFVINTYPDIIAEVEAEKRTV